VSRASLTTRTSGTLNRNYSSITVPSSSAGGFQLKEQPEREAVAHALSAATRAASTAAAADGSSSGNRSKHTSSRGAAAAASATPAYLHMRSEATPLSAARDSASQQQAMLDAVLGKPGSSSSRGSGSSSTAAAARGLTPAAARLAKKLKQSVSASPFGGALNGSSSSSRRRNEHSANWTPLASPSPVVAAGKQMSATAKGKKKASKKAGTGGLTDGLLKL
jgi:mating pheromone-induced death protein 2